MVFTLLLLLLIHTISEKYLHWYYKEVYKNFIPIINHSFIYSFIFFIPSFFIFKDILLVWYFLLTLIFTHYSINYLFYFIYNYIDVNKRWILLEIDNYLHISCLFFIYYGFVT